MLPRTVDDETLCGGQALDGPDGDLRGPEAGSAEDDLQGLDQLGGRPAVRGQVLGVVVADRIEVRVHPGPAEPVDGLLRVADQHHRRVPHERLAQDLPLHGVGVLELVHEHEREPVTQPLLRRLTGLRVPQRVQQPGLHVVERVQADLPLPLLHPRPYSLGERPSFLAPRGGSRRRDEWCVRVVDRGRAETQRRLEVEGHAVGPCVPRQVLVAHRLLDQVVDVLNRQRLGVVVGEHAQFCEHPVAELVGRADHGCVEPHQRGPDTLARDLGGDVGQHREPRRIGRHLARTCGGKHLRELRHPGPHPGPQLTGRRAGERDHHELVERDDPLGEGPCREGRDGMRLPRTGACLEHDRAAHRQWPSEVERGAHRWASSRGPYVSCASFSSPPQPAAASSKDG